MSSLVTSKPADAILVLDALAKKYATARNDLSSRVNDFNLALEKLRKEHMPKIQAAVAKCATAKDELQRETGQHPSLFIKPRTIAMHGIKVGFQKGTGALEWDDEAKVIAKIRELAPLSIDDELLIVTTEKLNAKGLELLRGDELKKLGVRVVDPADAVFIKAAGTDVDKLVKKILKEGRQPEEDES